MKHKSEIRKQTLKLKLDNTVGFKLLGISSHDHDYRVVWSMNTQFAMQFIRAESLSLHNQKLNVDMEFSRYIYYDEERYLRYSLISNRCPDGFLFPEMKNIDFILQVSGDMSESVIQALHKKIKGIDIVSAVFILAPDTIKGIEKILHE